MPLGIDSRALSPGLVKKIVITGVKERSEIETAKTIDLVGGVKVSAKTIERVLHDVGGEYTKLRDCPPSRLSRRLVPSTPEMAPESVSVSCDGGRMMTRQPGQGPGVHNPAWRETKNADFVRLRSRTFENDPHPELPECFRDREHVAKIAATAVLEITDEELDPTEPAIEELDSPQGTREESGPPLPEDPALEGEIAPTDIESCVSAAKSSEPPDPQKEKDNWKPVRIFRTCLSSLKNAREFGRQMQREASHRRFFEADIKTFIADGLGWNWRIWQMHFRDFEPILDFIHVIEYLYHAAVVASGTNTQAWELYLHWAALCWQGQSAVVIADLAQRLKSQGIDPLSRVTAGSALAVLHTAFRYLSNNESRMDYARYRRQGMPVTSAPMESLVKQIHQRVKGTEMFWNNSASGEGILQLRSAYLCEDTRLELYLDRRPGHPYVRRTTSAIRLQAL
jgi:hypothetical protein